MGSKRIYFIQLAALIFIILLLIGGTYLANTLLQKQAKKLLDLKTQVAVLTQQQTNLTKAKQDIAKYTSLNNIAKAIVPQDKDQAEAVREIVNLANANGLSLTAITFPNSTLGTTVAPTTGSGNSSSTTKPAPTQVTPVTGIPGVYNLPINVEQDPNNPVSYTKLSSFLSALEKNRRTAQVSSVNINPDTKDPSLLTFTLTIDEYIKP